jgi:hypothetical protein
VAFFFLFRVAFFFLFRVAFFFFRVAFFFLKASARQQLGSPVRMIA